MSAISWLGTLAGAVPVLMGLRTVRFAGWPHFGGINLVANGVVLMVLAWCAWPERRPWSWLLYAFVLYFVGANDLTILLRAGKFPVTAAPLLLGTVALGLQARKVWSGPRSGP